jgi:phosphoserine aminotransferase
VIVVQYVRPLTSLPDGCSIHPVLTGSLAPPATVKVLNFSPGPTCLAEEVEDEIKRLFDGHVVCSMYLSHRSPEFGELLREAVTLSREVMEIPHDYEVLFTHGGGHGQFAAVPMNLCTTGNEKATYLVNGTWSKRAAAEAAKYCRPTVISSENADDGSFSSMPSMDNIDPESKYVYLCSNETVNGIELHRLPKLGIKAPLVVDASSDFSTKPIDWHGCNVGILFACASKNIGHPGITMTVIRKDLLGAASPYCPGVLDYTINVKDGNLWNTTATFNVEVVGIVMNWIHRQGGVKEMEERSIAKSSMVYNLIDESNGFYSTPLQNKHLRSRMNVPFDVAGGDDDLTNEFLIHAWELGIVGLRTLTPFGVGKYLRASLYNGISVESTGVLVEFMNKFAQENTFRFQR